MPQSAEWPWYIIDSSYWNYTILSQCYITHNISYLMMPIDIDA